jgi:hypothetical protein
MLNLPAPILARPIPERVNFCICRPWLCYHRIPNRARSLPESWGTDPRRAVNRSMMF